MSRLTEYFSMYSLMSRRVMAVSSSNRNPARARASSVLPTPVGPRKMNEPMGRLGSLRPARARRTASETAAMASSWPMTRSCSRSSMWMSLPASPSSSRVTGMPVQVATMRAMSSASTSSLSMRLGPAGGGDGRLLLLEPVLQLDLSPVLQLGGAAVVGGPLGRLDLVLERLQLGLRLAQGGDGRLLRLPLLLEAAGPPR